MASNFCCLSRIVAGLMKSKAFFESIYNQLKAGQSTDIMEGNEELQQAIKDQQVWMSRGKVRLTEERRAQAKSR